MFLTGHRIDDGFAAPFRNTRNDDPSTSAVDVYVKVDARKNRIVNFFERRGKDLKDGCARLGILTGDDAEQGFTLFRRRSLVNDDGSFSLSLVNRALGHCA